MDVALPAAHASLEFNHTRGLTPQELIEFSQKWQLNKASTRLLQGLAPNVQKAVEAEFLPPEDTQNVSARFCVFARKKAERLAPRPVGAASSPLPTSPVDPLLPPGLQPIVIEHAVGADDADLIDSFVSRWDLDSSSVELLRGLPEDVRATMLVGFAPSSETRNVSGKLHAYARLLCRGARDSGAEFPNASEDSAAAAFARRWSLDGYSSSVLRNLQADVRAVVLADFCPAVGSSCFSQQFCAFAKLKTSGRPHKGQHNHSSGWRSAFEAPAPPIGGRVAGRGTGLAATEAGPIGQGSRWVRSQALANDGQTSWTPSLATHIG